MVLCKDKPLECAVCARMVCRMPKTAPHLLLLAGSDEARHIAGALALSGTKVTVSLAREDRGMPCWPVPTRVGALADGGALRSCLSLLGITAILDATHPFTAGIGQHSADLCRDLGLPYGRVLRPPWTPDVGDRWTEVADVAAATPRLSGAQRIFVTIGRSLLRQLSGIDPFRLWVRQLQAGPLPTGFQGATQLVSAGPFTREQEVALFDTHGIDMLFCKNSGGAASFSKLAAAREMALPVVLLARPPQPDAPILSTVEAAVDWVNRL